MGPIEHGFEARLTTAPTLTTLKSIQKSLGRGGDDQRYSWQQTALKLCAGIDITLGLIGASDANAIAAFRSLEETAINRSKNRKADYLRVKCTLT